MIRVVGGASRAAGSFRWVFMPLGLLALVAVGVHAAADVVDDRILRAVEALDAWLDAFLAQYESTAAWVNRVDSRERTMIARGIALGWELIVDFFVALPMLGYAEEPETGATRTFALVRKETWKDLFSRINRQPTLMRIVRPLVTLAFVLAGAYGVARLVEATTFAMLIGLNAGGFSAPEVASPIARIVAGTAMTILVFSPCWRAVFRALQHADQTCLDSKRPWLAGLRGTVLSIPLALALLLEAEAFLSFFR